MKIAIIGGGASGMFLASYLKRMKSNLDITIYDRNKGLGRKLLQTGNGKCNFSNFKATPFDYNNPSFIEKLLENTSKDELFNYFQSLGLSFYFDNEGRMYPETNSSETILNLFKSDLKDTKVILDTVNKLEVKNNGYLVNDIYYDKVILASGSNSNIDIKKVDSTYSYFNNLDIKLTKLYPSLAGFKTNANLSLLKGLRFKAIVYQYLDNKLIHLEKGEVIFKEEGISGIVIMNHSFYYKRNSNSYLVLDLYPNKCKEELEYLILKRDKEYKDLSLILVGICHEKLIKYLIKNNINKIDDIINCLKEFKIKITDTYSFKESQVTRGGIDLDQINSNFEFKKYKNLYAIGEILDIDGICGGYNLMFAFLSALSLGKELLK